jgi:hypothetical protein
LINAAAMSQLLTQSGPEQLQQLSRDSNVPFNCTSWGVYMTIKKSTAPLGPASVFCAASKLQPFAP